MTGRRYAAAMLFVLTGGCASTSPTPPPPPAPSTKPQTMPVEPGPQGSRKINRNLSGYSLAFKQGYVQGCESAESASQRRDESRYKKDADYAMGWNDGYSLCRR
jgi:hypothetical protein